MKPLLSISDFALGGHSFADLELRPGEAAHWRVEHAEEAQGILDALTGLDNVASEQVQWFDFPLASLSEKQHLKALARTLSLPPEGTLLANLTIEENLLLPGLQRFPRSSGVLRDRMSELVATPGGCCGHTMETLALLPYQLELLRRVSAGLVQAMLARPEVLLVCQPNLEGSRALEQLDEWLLETREALPDTAWLLLAPREEPPPGFLCQPTQIEESV